MPIDKDTCNGGQSTWNDRNNRLQNLQKDKEWWPPDTRLLDKGR